MFSPIKIILIIPLVAMILVFVVKLRDRPFYRLMIIVMGVLGILFVIYPDSTTTIANELNVGRGTDLLLYFSVMAGMVGMLLLYSKLRKIEATQTEIIRSHAIESASELPVR